MSDARRFLRYVMPGSVAATELTAYLAISNYGWLKDKLNDFLNSKNAADVAAVALGLFVASGVIGYFLSVLHHILYNHEKIYSGFEFVVDLGPSIRDAMRTRLGDGTMLMLRQEQNGSYYTPEDVSTAKDAWTIANILWYLHHANGSPLKDAETRSQDLWDLLHMSGTILIGSVIAAFAWFCIASRVAMPEPVPMPGTGYFVALFVAIIIVIIAGKNLVSVARTVEGVTNGYIDTYFRWRSFPMTIVWRRRARSVSADLAANVPDRV